jgi:hypothetical protein
MKIELNKEEIRDIILMHETIIGDLKKLKGNMTNEKSISNINEVIAKKTETLKYLKNKII